MKTQFKFHQSQFIFSNFLNFLINENAIYSSQFIFLQFFAFPSLNLRLHPYNLQEAGGSARPVSFISSAIVNPKRNEQQDQGAMKKEGSISSANKLSPSLSDWEEQPQHPLPLPSNNRRNSSG